MFNEVTPNINNSQAPPAPEAEASISQGNSNVIYEDVPEQTLKIDVNQNYTLDKCPAYEPHCPQHTQRVDQVLEGSTLGI